MSQYQTQRNRLLQKGYFGFKPEEAAAVVAHAYAHQRLDIDTWRLMSPIDGLQAISSPEAILRLDPAQQMTELVRMVVNLQLAGISALLNGNEPRDIVATMFGFTNFEALSDYARMDPVDPHSADPAMLDKFQARYGYPSAARTVLGRNWNSHTLIITDEAEGTSQFIDQEVCLCDLAGLQVALIRDNPKGDGFINAYSRTHVVARNSLSEDISSILMGAKTDATHLAVVITPKESISYLQAVQALASYLNNNAPAGRSLILDSASVSGSIEDLKEAISFADARGINLVLVTNTAKADFWPLFDTRLVFGLGDDDGVMPPPDMATVLVQASQFSGTEDGTTQYVHHSTKLGAHFASMNLIPLKHEQNIVSRIFGARRA